METLLLNLYAYYVDTNWKYFSIICSFNLGDGGVILESNETALNVWHTVEIQRNGRQGTLVVNGAIEAKVWWMKLLDIDECMINRLFTLRYLINGDSLLFSRMKHKDN